MNISIGQQIGRYQLVDRLGEGGMACVFKAYDKRLDRYVALKVIIANQQQSESFIKRFEREAKALAKLTHPNIVDIHDYGDYNGIPYLVMEYLPGGTLKNRMGAPVSYKESARLLIPIAEALDYAHKRNIIHRDIKPANILMTESGIPMLSDFGIAKVTQAGQQTQLTAVGVGIGTPEYMSPEQGRGMDIDLRSDIYSLGVVFFELLTGRKPFKADTPMATILKHISDPLPRPSQFAPDIPDEVELIIFKAMAKRPEDRYMSMAEFAQALERIAYGTTQPVTQIQEQQTVIRPRKGSSQPIQGAEIKTRVEPISPPLPAREGISAPHAGSQPFQPQAIPRSTQGGYAAPDTGTKRPTWFWYAIGGGVLLVVLCGVLVLGLGASSFFAKDPTATTAALGSTDTGESEPTAIYTATPALPTATEAPTPHPMPPKISSKSSAEAAWGDETSKSIIDLAAETYDSTEVDAVNRTLYYTVALEQSQPLLWVKGWCATTDERLSDNLNKISFSFYLDQTFVEINRLNTYKGQTKEGLKCVWFYALLDQWSAGEHLLVSKLTILQPINDGNLSFEKGDMIDEVLVTLK